MVKDAKIFCNPRNIRKVGFVYTGAAEFEGFQDQKKKPRGGSRGAMTRSLSGR